MEYREENNYPKAFLATGIILALLMAICYFIVFMPPPKLDEGTGGILVNYGTTDQGMGTDYMSTEQPSVAEKANHVKPDKLTPTPPSEKVQADNSDKKILTQNNEDAPAVATTTKKATANVAAPATKSVAKPVVNQNALYKGKANGGTGAGDGTAARKLTGEVTEKGLTWKFDSEYQGTPITISMTGAKSEDGTKMTGTMAVDPMGVDGTFSAVKQ